MKLLIALAALVAVAIAKPAPYSTNEDEGYGAYRGPFAPLTHDGLVIDTPEVANARAAHLAAYAQESAKSTYSGPVEAYDSFEHADYNAGPAAFGLQRSVAAPLDRYGRVIDTADVAQEKAAHFAAHANAGSNLNYSGDYGYNGPPAPLAQDGRVVDTPEVAQAKAAHLAAHAAIHQRND